MYSATCTHFFDYLRRDQLTDHEECECEELLCNSADQTKTYPQDSTLIGSICDTQIVSYYIQ